MAGSLFVRRYENWQDPGVLAPIYIAAFSLGPSLMIVAVARLSARALSGVAALAAAGILVMWWLFASSDSSTSALAFVMGWFVGIPTAGVIVAVVGIRSRGERPGQSEIAARRGG